MLLPGVGHYSNYTIASWAPADSMQCTINLCTIAIELTFHKNNSMIIAVVAVILIFAPLSIRNQWRVLPLKL